MKIFINIIILIFALNNTHLYKHYLSLNEEGKLTQQGIWSLDRIETGANTSIAIKSNIALKFNSNHTGVRIEKYFNYERSSSFSWTFIKKDDESILRINNYKLVDEKKKRNLDSIPPFGEPEFNVDFEYNIKFLKNDKELRLSYGGSFDNPAKLCYFKLE